MRLLRGCYVASKHLNTHRLVHKYVINSTNVITAAVHTLPFNNISIRFADKLTRSLYILERPEKFKSFFLTLFSPKLDATASAYNSFIYPGGTPHFPGLNTV